MKRTAILHLCFLFSSAAIAFVAFWTDHETSTVAQVFTGGNLVAFCFFALIFYGFHWLAYGIQSWLSPSFANRGLQVQNGRTLLFTMVLVVLFFIALSVEMKPAGL